MKIQHHHPILFFLLFVILTLAVNSLSAQEINVLYTGETHAMLYPCDCPKEPDGGIARRASLIKELKRKNPHVLVLDSGGFFAGGYLDEYGLNTELDMQRTAINLKAMQLMQYDAVALGDDEFNFGRSVLEENMAKVSFPFLSSNLKAGELFKPQLVKEIAGVKVGIIGVTGVAARQKAQGVVFSEPRAAVQRQVQELRQDKKADIIILLSHLGENEDLRLLKEIPGIDIIIVGHSRDKEDSFTKVENTLVVRPAWQGRKLGQLSLTIEDKKIKDYKVQELRLSSQISDDKEIISFLPRCFSDRDCRKNSQVGTCENPAEMKSSCVFEKTNKINLLIITPKSCVTCDTDTTVNILRKSFPGLAPSYIYYPEPKAKEIASAFGIKGLPVYLLGKELEQEKIFDFWKERTEKKGDYYMLKPEFGGIFYFINREKVKGKIDLFFSLYSSDTALLLETIKEFTPHTHFLAIEQPEGFEAAKGKAEVEEYLRAVCVQKYYPQKLWDYLVCRAKNINSSWWEDCLAGLDTQKIKTCARDKEGSVLLKENISLNKEIEVMFGPAYLVDNQEIFSSKAVPKKEEFQKLFKR